MTGDLLPDTAARAPPWAGLSGKYVEANAHFGEAELQAVVADHADVVRFQVSQFGIDPQGPLYSPSYVQEVQTGVQEARALGLTVIVSLQAEPPAGEPTRCPMPDAGAQRAWAQLASLFGGDDGVMFELYNEPAIAANAADWGLWANGGTVTYPGGTCQAVGMQALVDEIRAAAPANVIVVPGLAGEQSLAGMAPLTDPADPGDPQLVYGVHYPLLRGTSTGWDRAFGNASARVPVLVTEWDANSTTNCLTNAPAAAQLLLDYLASKQIGVVGFAFDLPGTIVADYSYTPTSYTGFACENEGGGPGQLLFADYAAEAQAADAADAWIIDARTMSELRALDPSMVGPLFDTPRTFVTGASPAPASALGAPGAVPAESFADERALAQAVNNASLRPGTEAVVYAPGTTPATPAVQQVQVGHYFQLAAQVAHAHGLLLIAAPSRTLTSGVAAARYADAYELPAQGDSTPAAAFSSYLRRTTAQVLAAHPSIELLSALTAATPAQAQALAGELAFRAQLQGTGP